jgi:hypothetical protein
MSHRDLFAQSAIAQLPKLLTLLDRNRHSPTYGCFDRNFWHYKIVDFPTGMAQEFVYPLALAYTLDCPHNPYYQKPVLRNWIEAGIDFAVRSSHQNGSCDDYFPFEQAAGASAFSLLACVESYQLLGLHNYTVLKFFEKRADWLAHHEESGRLSNHQALIILCLEKLSLLLNCSKWDRIRSLRLERLLEWQSQEGWFPEYEGSDPGYLSLTITCLAQISQLKTDIRLKEALIKAVEFASYFLHPDGSYGGEYASRNTYNFFPHGFELVGSWYPQALAINDVFLQGLANGLSPCYADDHIIGHHVWNYLLAWRDFIPERPSVSPRKTGQFYFPEAQLFIERRGKTELYAAFNKGGVFKVFRNHQLVVSDTQFSVLLQQGNQLKNAVGHLIDRKTPQVKIKEDEIQIQGELGWAKQTQMSPLKLVVLRVVMLSLGRFFPNLIRKILQTILITGKQNTKLYFQRSFRWENQDVVVKDELKVPSWEPVKEVGIGADQTSIYVVMSRVFQPSQLQPWLDLSDQIKDLSKGDTLQIERRY